MHVRYGSSRIGTILMQETSGHPCQHNSGYEEEGSACLMSWCVYLYCLNLWSACKLISLIDLELSPNEIIAVYSAVHEGPLCFLPIKIYTMLTNLDDRQHAAYLYRPGATATWSKAQVHTYVLSGVQCTSCWQRSSRWKDNWILRISWKWEDTIRVSEWKG